MKEKMKSQRKRQTAEIDPYTAKTVHELRNHLNVIQLASYNIAKRCNDPTLIKHITQIENKIEKTNRAINDLLNYKTCKI
ncbi:MAG: hypothetical protein LHV68_06625 [Elusimicrobia bacterium]|nr:hypothetical protein [Candidatus Liberimonas magnetica]